MRLKLMATAAAASLIIGACAAETDPSPSSTVDPGVAVPTDAELAGEYTPTYDGLRFAMPSAVESYRLLDSPRAVVAADRLEFVSDPLVKAQLVERGLGPSVIDIVQRGDDYMNVPKVSVTAIQFKGLAASDFSHMVASTYLLATSVDGDQHILTGAKPPTFGENIEGKDIRLSNWNSFELAWYPYGEVLFIVLAENPQLMASALRSLPPLGGMS